MEEDRREEENSVEIVTEESIQSEKEEHNPQPEDSSRKEIRSRSPLQRFPPTPYSKMKQKDIQRCKNSSFHGGVVKLTHHAPSCVDKMILIYMRVDSGSSARVRHFF